MTALRSEHGGILLQYENRSVSSHHLKTTVRAWLLIPLIFKNAPSVVIVSLQWSVHGDTPLRYANFSVSCHHLMNTDRAWFLIPKVWNMTHQLSSSHDNGPSIVIPISKEACTVSCHHLMTMDRAWLLITKVWNMLCQLSTSHDNSGSMVIPTSGMKHDPTVYIVFWQWSEYGDNPSGM